jgi:UDP-glucose 4-epimerase
VVFGVVTGSRGFLGQHVLKALVDQGHTVVGAARPRPGRTVEIPFEPDNSAFHDLLRQQPDFLVHAAGSASVSESVVDPHRDFQNSVELFSAVLDNVRRLAPRCKVILLSSAAVYGNPAHLPIDETAPTRPISPYGHHKLMAEQIGHMYFYLYGIPFVSARIFSAYGRGLRRQAVFDIASKLIAAQGDQPVLLHGTGTESRDFIHGEDVGRAIACIVDRAPSIGETYNIAGGAATRISDLASVLAEQLRCRAPIIFNQVVRSGDALNWQADIGKLERLGYTPRWQLETGIADLLQHELELTAWDGRTDHVEIAPAIQHG